MKQFKITMFLLMFTLILPTASANASTSLAQSLKGRILIQVEDLGQAWYVNPVTNTRYNLGRPSESLAILQKLALGMSNANLNKIADTDSEVINASFTKAYAGRILIQTENNGQAWYVNPVNLKKYYLGNPADVFNIMKQLGLGITNDNLMNIPLSDGSSANANPKTFNIAIKDTKFMPTNLEITRGDTIVWTNRDAYDHQIASSDSSLTDFGSGTLSSGKSYSYKFNNSGIYYYNGMLTPDLEGMIVVR